MGFVCTLHFIQVVKTADGDINLSFTRAEECIGKMMGDVLYPEVTFIYGDLHTIHNLFQFVVGINSEYRNSASAYFW